MLNVPSQNDHDLLVMQDRLMDRINTADPALGAEFKQFVRAYRDRLLTYKQEPLNEAIQRN